MCFTSLSCGSMTCDWDDNLLISLCSAQNQGTVRQTTRRHSQSLSEYSRFSTLVFFSLHWHTVELWLILRKKITQKSRPEDALYLFACFSTGYTVGAFGSPGHRAGVCNSIVALEVLDNISNYDHQKINLPKKDLSTGWSAGRGRQHRYTQSCFHKIHVWSQAGFCMKTRAHSTQRY